MSTMPDEIREAIKQAVSEALREQLQDLRREVMTWGTECPCKEEIEAIGKPVSEVLSRLQELQESVARLQRERA
jgi:hypothetical protein